VISAVIVLAVKSMEERSNKSPFTVRRMPPGSV
jgi:hypothetical protein